MYIDELELWSRDLSGLHQFYGALLGLPVVTANTGLLELQVGATLLRFMQAPTGWRGFYHFAFNVPENQFAAAQAWLAAQVPLIADRAGRTAFHSESWNADQLYFYDPAGNIGELIARHTLANGTSADFGPQCLLSVSEIGVVVDAVPTAAQTICAQLGVEHYQGSSHDFAPLGDEHGLLIVVERGRVWFPDTGKPAVPAPVRLLVRTSQRIVRIEWMLGETWSADSAD